MLTSSSRRHPPQPPPGNFNRGPPPQQHYGGQQQGYNSYPQANMGGGQCESLRVALALSRSVTDSLSLSLFFADGQQGGYGGQQGGYGGPQQGGYPGQGYGGR